MVKQLFLTALISLGLLFYQMTADCFADAADAPDQTQNDLYTQAEQTYKNIVQQYPATNQALQAQKNLTILYIAWDKQPQADAAFQQLLTNFSGNKRIAPAVCKIGHRYRNFRKYEKAKQAYQYVVSNWPQDNQAMWSQRGIVLSNIDLGNETAAEAAVGKLLADFADNDRIANAVCGIAGHYRGLGKREKADQVYQRIVDDAEKWRGGKGAMWAQMTVAISHIFLGNETAADAAVDKLLSDFAAEEHMAGAVCRIANNYRNLSKYEKAKELYQYVIAKRRNDNHAIWAQLGLAMVNIGLANEPAAEAAINKLLSDFGRHPYIANGIYNIAASYRRLGKYEKAERLYQYILEHCLLTAWPGGEPSDDPNTLAAVDKLISDFRARSHLPKGLYDIAAEFKRLGRYDQAEDIYKQIIQQYPGSSFAGRAQLAIPRDQILSLTDDGNDITLKAALDKLVADFSGHPDLGHAVFSIAERYYAKGARLINEGLYAKAKDRFQKAAVVWEKLTKELPECGLAAVAYYLLGDCYCRLGEYEKAISCYQTVANNHPTYRYAWNALRMIGQSYEFLKNSELVSKSEADIRIMAAYEQLIEKYPECPDAEYVQSWIDSHNSK